MSKRFVVASVAVVLVVGVGLVGLIAHERAGPRGTISGHLFGVGGPPHSPRPWPGTVRVRSAVFTPSRSDALFLGEVSVGSDGSYSISVPPGSYTVVGTSPLYEAGRVACRPAPQPPVITVKQGDVVVVDVLCQMR
jgi:hypothetical protein